MTEDKVNYILKNKACLLELAKTSPQATEDHERQIDVEIQDFLCKLSDLIWGGELGWDSPDGLNNLFKAIKSLRDERDRLRGALQGITNAKTFEPVKWQEMAQQALKGEE